MRMASTERMPGLARPFRLGRPALGTFAQDACGHRQTPPRTADCAACVARDHSTARSTTALHCAAP